jgi:uncharacterized phage protein (TIGR01671 family)
MKRPIKFRFWCNAGKSFIQQYRYSGYVDELFDEKEYILTPSQYTGIKDCEGKEIWEGDIVEFERVFVHSTDRTVLRGIVEFDDGGFHIIIKNPPSTLSIVWLHQFADIYENKLKVIGNKFENKDLLF